MSDLKEKIKKIKIIREPVAAVKRVYYHQVKKYIAELKGRYRNKYDKLHDLKGLFDGKRCFIVCTGPSLNYHDLDLIKQEYCFGMNSIVKVFNETEWRPYFYGIQDFNVYEKMRQYLIDDKINSEINTIFVSDDIAKKFNDIPKGSYIYPLNYYGHEYFDYGKKKPMFKFSDDISKNVYDGYSVTYSLIQIAYYLGFKEIYLLGCDCSYAKEPEKQHFVSSGHVDPNAAFMGALQSMAYAEAQKFCESHDLKIYNATRGGYLEIFERVKLEEVINDKEIPKK